jgi:hypothetical protein
VIAKYFFSKESTVFHRKNFKTHQQKKVRFGSVFCFAVLSSMRDRMISLMAIGQYEADETLTEEYRKRNSAREDGRYSNEQFVSKKHDTKNLSVNNRTWKFSRFSS